jgi:hypothetical protein
MEKKQRLVINRTEARAAELAEQKRQNRILDNAEVWELYRSKIKRGADEALAPRFEEEFAASVLAMMIRQPSGFLQALSWAMFECELSIEPPAEIGHCCMVFEALAESYDYGKTLQFLEYVRKFDPRP